RKARFRTVLCVVPVDENGAVGTAVACEGELDGRILEAVDTVRIEGFPYESLFWADEYGMILGDLHRLPDDVKHAGKFNHRERAIEKAIPIIQKMMAK
ncbi:MAG: non-canonical purine NTP pyrophosphatase, partial [Candidatus Pacebacteria bacterium]|nr:non-canonical purine NTP pyrophosphatase [Candidatus Paceibacterota bacterium]